MSERLIDLDELILRCKDKVTKEYIQEAVACYRAGAFRSCIVSTWNAVVFDYLYKLRELEIAENGEAKVELEKFNRYRESKQYKELWNFEEEIPEKAQKQFEFISLIEKDDLKRLFDDRSRCAHPSMQSVEEPFQPSPELARYHLRNAVTHFLQYPPVQGRAFKEQIWKIIESQNFPSDNVEQAVEILKSSYLAKARRLLVKDIIVGLTKALILEEKPEQERYRMYTALEAVKIIHPKDFQEIVKDALFKTILRVPDEQWYQVFAYLRRFDVGYLLEDGQRHLASNCLDRVNQDNLGISGRDTVILIAALEISVFHEKVLEKLKNFSTDSIEILVKSIYESKKPFKNENIFELISKFKADTIQDWTHSGSFASSTKYGKRLILISSWLTPQDLKTILQAFLENGEIHRAWKFIPDIMKNLFNETENLASELKSDWLAIYNEFKEDNDYQNLVNSIRLKFPDDVEEQNS